MSAKEQVRKEIIEAYLFLRTNNSTVPSETLSFMKDSSLKALDEPKTACTCWMQIKSCYCNAATVK